MTVHAMRHPHTGLSRIHTRKHVFGLCRPTRMATNPATQSESVKQQPDTPSTPVHTTLYSCLAKPQHVGVCTCIASSRICGQHSLVKHQGNPNSPPYGFHPYWIISLRLQGPPPFPPWRALSVSMNRGGALKTSAGCQWYCTAGH